MKLKTLTYGLLAGAMLVSCSEDMKVTEPNAGDANLTTGYIGVAIGMPSDATTRGVNDNFNDGTDGEYKVNTAAVIFFKGQTENGSKFYRAYNLTNEFQNVEDDPNQITSQSLKATFPVDFAKEADEKLWAMAVINFGQANISVNANSDDSKASAVVKINDKTVDESWTIETFMSLITDKELYSNSGANATNFFMVNSPYSRIQGGYAQPGLNEGNDFRVLADVDRSKIYETAAEAEANPATEIFVERAVAKVDVSADNILGSTLPGGVKVKSVEWVLNNTEPSSYIVRNLQKVSDNFNVNSTPKWATYTSDYLDKKYYRFIGQAPLKDLAKYRTYFCEDPNGDGLEVDASKTLKVTETPTFLPSGSAYPQYCHENTFSVENMNTFNTTCAMIKVTYEDAKGDAPTFYTIGLNNTQMFTFENAARVLAVDVISNETIRKTLEDYYVGNNEAYDNNISTSNLQYYQGEADKVSLKADNEWMSIEFSNTTVEGRLVISHLTLYDGKTGTKGEEIRSFNYGDEDGVITALNEVQEIKAYTNGVSYYSILIKHFGDEYTPWTPTKLGIIDTTPTTQESYFTKPNHNENFLGRYGVVRNNWYTINITKINNFGEPTTKDIHFDGTPDDKYEKEESISCRINILSWAKRQQSNQL